MNNSWNKDTFHHPILILKGIKLEPHKKQLHLTLAYQYPQEQHDKLLKYAKEIDLTVDVRWDLRLYSRDPRASKSEVNIEPL